MSTLHDIRKDYTQRTLSESEANPDPLVQFNNWLQDATAANIDEVNAMTLATAGADGLPAARIVLLKEVSENGFVFFSNYKSYKARHLEENPKACLVFFWKEMERQIRITGIVSKLPAAESDAYFHSRPVDSQVGAQSSPQSQVIPGREWLEEKFAAQKIAYEQGETERPQHWGGYRVTPVVMEFWQGRHGRLHDRLQYSVQPSGGWCMERLAP